LQGPVKQAADVTAFVPAPCPIAGPPTVPKVIKEIRMKWQTPAVTEFRFGFEITMYIANR
jgi:coenzyme PQQ precursor peptide PqqA